VVAYRIFRPHAGPLFASNAERLVSLSLWVDVAGVVSSIVMDAVSMVRQRKVVSTNWLRKGKVLGLSCALALMACEKDKGSSTLSVSADYLTLAGRAVSDGGVAISDANLYVEGIDSQEATTSADGGYSFTLHDTELDSLRAKAQQSGTNKSLSLRVYAEALDRNPKLMGMSESLSLNERGKKPIGNILMQPAATLTADVKVVGADGEPSPATNTVIHLGRYEATTDLSGRFTTPPVPAGSQKLSIERDGSTTGIYDLALTPGENRTASDPYIIFPDGIVAAWISPKDPADIRELINSGHPYRRSFRMAASPNHDTCACITTARPLTKAPKRHLGNRLATH
jgi:hypothetical protein